LVALGGVLLLAILVLRLGPGRILELLSALGANFLIVVLLFVGHEIMRVLAVRRCLPAGNRPPLRDLLRIRLLGEAAGTLTRTGPVAAEPARAWLLARQQGLGMPAYAAAIGELMANSLVSAAVNVAVAGWLLLTVAQLGAIRVLAHVLLWGSLTYLSLVVGALVLHVRFVGPLAGVAGRLPLIGRRLRFNPLKLREVDDAIRSVFATRPSSVAVLLLLQLSAQMLLVTEVWWMLGSMGVAVSFGSAFVAEVMSRVAIPVQFVGVTEVAFAVIYRWLGMPAAVGLTASLVKTLRSLTAAGIICWVLPTGTRWIGKLVSRRQRGSAVESGA
jgi:hypothetical protein